MSLHLQRWRRLNQTWVLKKYRQTHRMCSLLVRLFVNWQLFTSIIRYRTKSNLIFSFQIFCSRRSLKATQSNLKLVVNQGQLAFALQEVVKLVKHIPPRPRHMFHHNSHRKKLQIGDDKTPRRQEVKFLYSTCCECFCFSCQSVYSCVNYLLSFW